MKAIRVAAHGGPEVLRLEDVPVPEPPAGHLRIRVAAAGLNFIEVYQRTGLYPMTLPYTPGSEGAGEVVAVGPGVTGFAVGDQVASVHVQGAYAEEALVPADRAVRIPDGVDARSAAAVLLQGMTAHYLVHSTFPLKPGHSCLIHAAAGGVGLLLIQMAKHCGALVFGTTSTREKARLAQEAGADDVILYTSEDFVARVKEATGDKGVSVVYDSVGATTFLKGLDCLRPLGMMVVFGQSSGVVAPLSPSILAAKGSLFLTRPTLFHYIADRQSLETRASAVFGAVKDGTLKLRIDRDYKLADAGEAHKALEARATTGKVLLAN